MSQHGHNFLFRQLVNQRVIQHDPLFRPQPREISICFRGAFRPVNHVYIIQFEPDFPRKSLYLIPQRTFL